MRGFRHLMLVLVAAFTVIVAGGCPDDASNDAPVMFAPLGAFAVAGDAGVYTADLSVGDSLRVSFAASDADTKDELTLTVEVTSGTMTAEEAGFVTTLPATVTNLGSVILTLEGIALQAGMIELLITVDDGKNDPVVLTLTMTVTGNDAPQIFAPTGPGILGGTSPDFTADVLVGASLAFAVTVTDINPGNALAGTVAVTGGTLDETEAGFDIFPTTIPASSTATTLLFSGIAAQPGTIEITVSVNDGQGGNTVSMTHTLTLHANSAPVLTLVSADGDIDPVSATENNIGVVLGESLAFEVDATDADTALGDTLTVTIAQQGGNVSAAEMGFTEALPLTAAGASPISSTMSGTALNYGRCILQVTATDSVGASVVMLLSFRVPAPQREFDMNGDGFVDFVIGAPGYEITDDEGAVYVFLGSASMPVTFAAADADMIIYGALNEWIGSASYDAGDVNGDGFSDVIVGAAECDTAGLEAGAAFIFYGAATLPATVTTADADVKLYGPGQEYYFGLAANGIGDFNDDGFDDVAVGAPLTGGTLVGAGYVFFGSDSLPATINATNADVTISGVGVEYFGYGSTVGLGDMNGDGYDDFAMGAAGNSIFANYGGAVYTFFGGPSPSAVMTTGDADMAVYGTSADTLLGLTTIGAAGDVNGDGLADLLVGSATHAAGNPGAALIYGQASYAAPIMFASADVVITDTAGTAMGYVQDGVGDVNGDGYSDFMVSAVLGLGTGTDCGEAYLFLGGPALPSTMTYVDADTTFQGEQTDGVFGTLIRSFGDLNQDGYSDIIIGAYGEDGGASESGCAYLFLGAATLPAQEPSSNAATKFEGENTGDYFGMGFYG